VSDNFVAGNYYYFHEEIGRLQKNKSFSEVSSVGEPDASIFFACVHLLCYVGKNLITPNVAYSTEVSGKPQTGRQTFSGTDDLR